MKNHVLLLVSLLLLAACGDEYVAEPTEKVYKPLGSLQCGMGDITPPGGMRKDLESSRIPVRSFGCGMDGLFHPSACGEPDGAINVFTIPRDKLSKALSLGFKPLKELANATEKPCE
jgi:hypothetical protein